MIFAWMNFVRIIDFSTCIRFDPITVRDYQHNAIQIIISYPVRLGVSVRLNSCGLMFSTVSSLQRLPYLSAESSGSGKRPNFYDDERKNQKITIGYSCSLDIFHSPSFWLSLPTRTVYDRVVRLPRVKCWLTLLSSRSNLQESWLK